MKRHLHLLWQRFYKAADRRQAEERRKDHRRHAVPMFGCAACIAEAFPSEQTIETIKGRLSIYNGPAGHGAPGKLNGMFGRSPANKRSKDVDRIDTSPSHAKLEPDE